MTIDLDNIPRTVKLIRASIQDAPVPEGFPILEVLDQTKLPEEVVIERIADWRQVIDAIKRLSVRGAPAIGIAGASAIVLRAAEFCFASSDEHRRDALDLERVFVIDDEGLDNELYLTSMSYCADMVKKARPTAVNLAWAVDRCMDVVERMVAAGDDPAAVASSLFDLVERMIREDESANRSIGAFGAALLPDDACVLTHCNAGSLATSFFGTALGVIYESARTKGIKMVYADETRPVCQGSRLTVWELSRAGVPVTLICDDMAASVLASGEVDAVIVGADRIAANGDVANKIGTLGLAIMAKELDIPFIVAAPLSTLDMDTATGADIVIEQRDAGEVLEHPIEGVDVYNPAFDVTPAKYVDRIVTEVGAFEPGELASAFDVRAVDGCSG